jgi:undecaprenyl-phosphate galactose phosphotransferase
MQRVANRLKALSELFILLLIDVLSIFCVFILAVIVRAEILPGIFPTMWNEPFSMNYSQIWWVPLIWLFLFLYEGLYTKRSSFWDEIKTLWKASFFAAITVFTIVSIGKLSPDVSRTLIILMWLISLPIVPLIRVSAKNILRGTNLFSRKAIIIGAGETGSLILKALRNEPNYGYKVVGFIDDSINPDVRYLNGVKIHKGITRIEDYIRRCNIMDVFITMPYAEKEDIRNLINKLQHKVERIFLIPDIPGLAVLGTELHHFFHEQTIALEIKNNLENPLNIVIKKAFDFTASVILLFALCIPIALISLLIIIDSPGPAIFTQQRIGKNGRRIKCYKFRTMYKNAENQLEELFASNDKLKEEYEKFWKLKNDPRVTRIGKFLRKTSLDELPQLFNVLKGEMSLVGPRPVTQEEIDIYYGENAALCFSVLPGITGLWQVSGRTNTTYDHRIVLDLWYVRNWSLWLDIVILLKTIKVVLKMEGAY